MWRRTWTILLVLFVSAIPTLIVLMEFGASKIDDSQIEFYKALIPSIIFLGVSLALVSVSDYAEFRDEYTGVFYGASKLDHGSLPLLMFLLYVLLAFEFMLYYQFSSYITTTTSPENLKEFSSKIYSLTAEPINSSPLIKKPVELSVLGRLFRTAFYVTWSVVVLYVAHMLFAWDARLARKLYRANHSASRG